MNRCSPVEMRKNLQVVEAFEKLGIDFVVIPAKDESHKEELINLSMQIMDEIVVKI